VVSVVYKPLVGNTLKEETNRILDLYSMKFPQKFNPSVSSGKDKLHSDVNVGEVTYDNRLEVEDQASEDDSHEIIDELLMFSRQEVVDIFKVSLPTLKDWEKKGIIPKAVRLGNRVYFRRVDIINHIKASNSEINKT